MNYAGENADLAQYDLLATDGWLEWNSQTWDLEAHRVLYEVPGQEFRLSGILYTDKHGRVRMPPLNPYLPFKFEPSGPLRPERVTRQWLTLASLFADDLISRKVVGRINLPPNFTDGRPFQWRGFAAETRYTYMADLPYSSDMASRAVRKNIAKALRAGYTFELSDDPVEIVRCLRATANRKGFEYRLTDESLSKLFGLLKSTDIRAHIVRDNQHEVVSAGIRLLTSNGVALDWVQGTEVNALRDGAAQLMYSAALEDLGQLELRSFDYGGANIREVAEAKAAWGMRLTPFLTITQHDARLLYRSVVGATRRFTKR